MPNWVKNRVKICAEDSVIAKIMKECINEEGDFDFELVIPMPDNIYRGPLGWEEEKKYGAENCWYDWSVKHWGTKWNCTSEYVERSHAHLTIVFETAWSTPLPIIIALDKKYHLEWIECEFADEDMGSNVGTYGIDDEGFYDIEPTDPLKKACEVWGYDYDGFVKEYCGEDEDE